MGTKTPTTASTSDAMLRDGAETRGACTPTSSAMACTSSSGVGDTDGAWSTSPCARGARPACTSVFAKSVTDVTACGRDGSAITSTFRAPARIGSNSRAPAIDSVTLGPMRSDARTRTMRTSVAAASAFVISTRVVLRRPLPVSARSSVIGTPPCEP